MPISSWDEVVLSLQDDDRKPLSIDETLLHGGRSGPVDAGSVLDGGGGVGNGSTDSRCRSGGGM
jgi:hypothetical protein